MVGNRLPIVESDVFGQGLSAVRDAFQVRMFRIAAYEARYLVAIEYAFRL